MKTVAAFIAGCLITGVIMSAFIAEQKNNRQVAQNQMLYQLNQVKQLTQERDSCQQKFSRNTVLYERPTTIFGQPNDAVPPTRLWTIPADVEPQYVGRSQGLFSHYDPKTQVETVKLPAK